MKRYNDDLLKKVQNIELEILTEIIRICEINNIEYYLDFGSLLGAVRHGGFIPWDDDIDISMRRNDYEKFLEVAPLQLKEGFSLQHFFTEKNTPTYWAKIVKDGTLFTEKYMQSLDINQGIFVDIFPIDKVPDSPNLQRKHLRKIHFLRNMYISKTVSQVCTEKNKIKRILYTIVRRISHLVLKPISKKVLYNILDYEIRKFNTTNSNTIAVLATHHSTHCITTVFPLKKMYFSGICVSVPNNVDQVLKREYGDYMKLPPEKDRIGHCPDFVKI